MNTDLEDQYWVQLGRNRYAYSQHQANCIVNWFMSGFSIGWISRQIGLPRLVVKKILISAEADK